MSTEERAVDLYTSKLRECMEAVPEDLRLASEEILRNKAQPTLKLYEIKRAFWEEFAEAELRGKKMRIWRIHQGRCNKEYFYSIIKDPVKMAWIMSPLVSYEDKAHAVLDKISERYAELIEMDITTTKRVKQSDGSYEMVKETDPRKALVLLQTIKNVEDRVKGTAVQRQVSVHTDRPVDAEGAGAGSLDMDAVNDRLKELESKLGGSIDGSRERITMASRDVEDHDGEISRAERQGERRSDEAVIETRAVPITSESEGRERGVDDNS